MGNKLFIFKKILLLSAIFFAITNAIILGMSWDEPFHYEMGKNRLKYLFSLGKYDFQYFYYFSNLSHFPGLYDTLTAFISQMVSSKYEVQIHHLCNLFFSL